MVSAPKSAAAGSTIAATPAMTTRPVAHLNARISAYLVDSVVLLAFILVFFVIGGAVLLFSSDLGKDDAPDSAYYASIAVFLGGSLLAWTAFNLALMRWRGQTIGMYIIGIRVVGRDDATLTSSRIVVRWLGLHPLLFHPLLLPVCGTLAVLAASVTLNQVVLIVTLALVVLCIVSPAATLALTLLDNERRALHDRLADTIVVRL